MRAMDKSKVLKKTGIVLVVLSGVFWLLIPPVHLLKISTAWKAAIDVMLFVAAEIAFWGGSYLLGKEFYPKLKEWFRTRILRRSARGKHFPDIQERS